MKGDRVTNLLLALLVALLAGVGAKVWEGVELAREGQTVNGLQARELLALRADVKENRSDLDWLYGSVSEVAGRQRP